MMTEIPTHVFEADWLASSRVTTLICNTIIIIMIIECLTALIINGTLLVEVFHNSTVTLCLRYSSSGYTSLCSCLKRRTTFEQHLHYLLHGRGIHY